MKSLIPSSILLLISSVSLSAEEVADMQSSRNQPTSSSNSCCPAPKPCCPQKPDCIPARCAQLVGGPKGEITPNAGPCVSCGMDVYVTADFLYWMVREDHLGYVLTSGDQFTSNPVKGKTFHPNFKMKPGFKVGIGMGYDHDGWDTFLEYTWIRAKNINDHATPSSNAILRDAFWTLGNSNDDLIRSASAHWELHYFNALDLELGRNFYVSRYLMLRPHFGFKGTWQKQFYDVTTETTAIESPMTGDLLTNAMRQSQFFWGFGIRAGLDAAWHFSRSFSLIGEVALSGLYGQFEVSRLNTTFDNTTQTFIDGITSPFAVTNNFHTIKPVVEWFIGLRWETYTCDNEYHFSLEAGWEEQFWGQQNQMLNLLVEGQNGDLGFQGLTFKARFDF